MGKENEKTKLKFRHIITVILILLNVFINNGFWSVNNSYELLILFIVLTLPFSALLFFISFFSKKKDIGWQKKLSLIGMIVAAAIIVIVGFLTAYRLIDYYFLS